MGKEESSSYDDNSASWDESERPSQRAWTHEDIYPTEKHESDLSSSDDESSEGDDDDDSTEEESSDEDDDSSSSSTSFAEAEPPKPKPKSNRSSSNYESLSEPDSSSDDDSDASGKPVPAKGNASKGKQDNSSAYIEKTLKSSKQAISEAEERRKKQLQSVEKSGVERQAQEKKMLDISKHLDDEIQNVSSVLENSDMAGGRVTQKSMHSIDSKTTLKQLEREERLERAKERIEKENEEKEQKERKEKNAKMNVAHDTSEKARIERAYTWYTRMAMPSREKMKERIALMSSTTGVTEEDVDLLPWNARGTFVSVATMMKIQRTSASAVGRKK